MVLGRLKSSFVPSRFSFFYERGWEGGVLKVIKNDHFFSVFSVVSPFPQVFGQVKEWIMLE